MTVDPVIHEGQALMSVSRAYTDAVSAAGGLPLVLPVLAPGHVERLLEGLDGLVLSGGVDVSPSAYGELAHPETKITDPARDAFEIELIAAAMARDMPILGICRGHQILNVALGGTLIQHLPHSTSVEHRNPERQSDGVHPVEIMPNSMLLEIVQGSRVGVNSLHHQAVAGIGKGLRVVAHSCADGTIEAVESTDGRPLLGVQWHPELLQFSEPHRAVFRWLVDACRVRMGRGSAIDVGL